MALGYILISVLHIFSFSSMFLSSTLLFVQPLPQTSETHTEIQENHLQAQKKNLGHATPLWPRYLGCTMLSANFMPFPRINRDQTGRRSTLWAEDVFIGRRITSLEHITALPFWDCCTLSTCEDVDKWTTYQLTPSVYQGDAHPVPCLHHQSGGKQVCWAKAVSWNLSWSTSDQLVSELEWQVIEMKFQNVFEPASFSAVMSRHLEHKIGKKIIMNLDFYLHSLHSLKAVLLVIWELLNRQQTWTSTPGAVHPCCPCRRCSSHLLQLHIQDAAPRGAVKTGSLPWGGTRNKQHPLPAAPSCVSYGLAILKVIFFYIYQVFSNTIDTVFLFIRNSL